MSIAFSKSDLLPGTIFYGTISGGSKAAFLADFLAAALSVGWSYTPITDGYLFSVTSKQGLPAKVKLWDRHLLGADELHIQWMDVTETLVGCRHRIPMLTGRTFLLHMNNCQYFCGEPGLERGISFQGGVPWCPNVAATLGSCVDELFGDNPDPTIVEQAFWSCGCDASNTSNFRISFAAEHTQQWSTLLNSDLMNAEITNTYTTRNQLRLLPVLIATPVPNDFWSNALQHTKKFDGSELRVDPLLAWGDSSGDDVQAKHRGQLYDAFIPTLPYALDQVVTNIFGTDWVNYQAGNPSEANESRFGGLFLALAQPSGGGGEGGPTTYCY